MTTNPALSPVQFLAGAWDMELSGDKPLVVLTADRGSDAAWMAAQDKTATLSANSVHRVVEGASHPDLILKQAVPR